MSPGAARVDFSTEMASRGYSVHSEAELEKLAREAAGKPLESARTFARDEAEGLLSELLSAYGLSAAQTELDGKPALTQWRADVLAGLPTDRVERSVRYVADLERVLPELRALVHRVRGLRVGRLHHPVAYATEWRDIITTWNATLHRACALSLPPLCDACGTPMLRRRGTPNSRGGMRLATTCSEKCRDAEKKRAKR